jgi:hypothetical protein
MRTIWVTAFLIAAAGCTTTMRISRQELQADVVKRFPRDIDKHVVTLRASDPVIDFPGSPDMLGVSVRLDATTDSGNSHLGGTARVVGRLEYVSGEHAFYLRDGKVTELTLERPDGGGHLARAMHHADNALLERVARSALEELLRRQPIYRLDANRSKREAKAIRHIREAHIDGKDLVLRVGL